MKTTYLIALAALMVMAFAAVSANAADDQCYTTKSDSQYETTCPNCPAPAWDRTPVYVFPEGRRPYEAPPVPGAIAVDPWDLCGAFCQAGQIPAGWPYGWEAEYWLRPDSNL